MKIASCFVLLLFGTINLEAQTLVSWDIGTSVAGTSGTTSGTVTLGTGLNAGLSAASTITITGSIGGTTAGTGWRWYDGAGQATDLSSALSTSNYFSFNVTASSTYDVTISGLGATSFSRGSSAPTTLALLYSTDSSFSSYRTISSAVSIPSSASDISASLAGDLSTNPLSLSSGTTGYFRLAFWGATTTTSGAIWVGNGTNDFSLTGSSTALVTARNTRWNGGNGTWDTTTSNFQNTGSGNATTTFQAADNVTIDSAATISVQGGGVTSSGNLNVTNGSGDVTISGGSMNFLSLAKSGSGNLVLSAANTFSGGVSVTGGVLESQVNNATGNAPLTLNGGTLKLTANVTSLANTLTIGSAGGNLSNAGDVTISSGLTTSGAAALASNTFTKSGAGNLTITGVVGSQMTNNTTTPANSTGGAVNLNISQGGVIFSGTSQRNLGGTMTWDGNVTLNAGTLMMHGATVSGNGSILIGGNSTIAARLNFGTSTVANGVNVGTGTVLTLDTSNPSTMILSGPLSGNGSIVMNGNGGVRLNNATESTFSGTVTVEGTATGSRTITTQALGSASALILNATTSNLSVQNSADDSFGAVISGPGSLTINSSSAIVTLTANSNYTGNTYINAGTLRVGAGTDSGAIGTTAAITNNGALVYNVGSGDRTLSANITGTGSVTQNGTGILTLSGTNSYSGGTVVNSGTVRGVIGSGNLSVASGALFDLNGANSSVATLSGAGGIALGANSLTSNSAVNSSYSGNFSGTGSFTKSGTGVLSLSGTSTVGGGTTVTAGGLSINGALTGNVAINSGAALSGTGTIVGDVSIAGAHTPGNSPGIQTITGNLSYASGSSVTWELGANTSTQAANPAANFDQVMVSNTLDFSGATTLSLSFNSAGSTVLWSDAFWSSNQSWKVYDAAVLTGFSNLTLASLNWADSQDNLFNTALAGSSFSLRSTAGNDIFLDYTSAAAIPEPATLVLFAGAVALGFAVWRRRRA